MTVNGLLARLQSASMKARIAATYELDYDDFDDPRIVAAVRENLGSAEPDLVEITIMRLLIRGKDAQSLERVLTILRTTRDALVFSAAILALTNLARDYPETAAITLQKLEVLSRSDLSADELVLLSDALAELFALAGKRRN